MTKKSRKKCEYHENDKSFFIIFKGLLFAKNCLKLESAPLIYISNVSKELLNVSVAR